MVWGKVQFRSVEKYKTIPAISYSGMRILYPGLSKLIRTKWTSIKEQYYNEPEIAIIEAGKWDWKEEYLNSLKNRRSVLASVKETGMDLQFFGKFKDDKPLVIWAVKQNGLSLKYASDRLQDDEKVVKEAAKQNSESLQYSSLRLQEKFGYEDTVSRILNATNQQGKDVVIELNGELPF